MRKKQWQQCVGCERHIGRYSVFHTIDGPSWAWCSPFLSLSLSLLQSCSKIMITVKNQTLEDILSFSSPVPLFNLFLHQNQIKMLVGWRESNPGSLRIKFINQLSCLSSARLSETKVLDLRYSKSWHKWVLLAQRPSWLCPGTNISWPQNPTSMDACNSTLQIFFPFEFLSN